MKVTLEDFPKPEIESLNETAFIFPNIKKELGEIKRVAQKYSPGNPDDFVVIFYEKALRAELVDLTEEAWSVLDNTDSFDITYSGWEQVAEQIDHTNQETGAARSWQDLKQKMEQGQEIDAPIILKHAGEMHLVSGNTRLMVSRALGRTPKVLFVEM